MESSCALALKGGLQGLQGQTESWENVLKETLVSRIIEVNPIPLEVFLSEKSGGEEDLISSPARKHQIF